MTHAGALFLLVLWYSVAPLVRPHGRLIEPPSRASAWRYGFSTPPNYNDHELYCGGFSRQWERNLGKCGICGDAWDMAQPRPHELGGTYGQGVIVRKYNPRSMIVLRVELTANHNGHFEFRLCTNYRNTTQECLDRHVLRLARTKMDGEKDPLGYRYYPKDGNRIYEMRYRLPEMQCSHCVLQWIYTAANNWGNCPNGTGAVGCGPQEEFRACADIAIGSSTATETESEQPLPPFIVPTTVPPTETEMNYNHGVTTVVITAVTFFIVVVLLALLYIYYYQVGKRIKSCLKRKELTTDNEKPVAPPRAKRLRHADEQLYNVSLDCESLA